MGLPARAVATMYNWSGGRPPEHPLGRLLDDHSPLFARGGHLLTLRGPSLSRQVRRASDDEATIGERPKVEEEGVKPLGSGAGSEPGGTYSTLYRKRNGLFTP